MDFFGLGHIEGAETSTSGDGDVWAGEEEELGCGEETSMGTVAVAEDNMIHND